MTDLTQLEALARAATPGEWIVDDPNDHLFGVMKEGVLHYLGTASPSSFSVSPTSDEQEAANAAYIAAANPAAILALIERVRVAEAQVAFNQQTIPMAPEHKATEDMHKSMAEGIRRVLKAGTWP